AELQTLALAQKLASRELVADHERARAGRVHDCNAGLQFPGAREKRRQVDARTPLDAGLVCFPEQNLPDRSRAVAWQIELLAAVEPGIRYRQAIDPIPPSQAQRRIDGHRRVTRIVEQLQRVGRRAAGDEQDAVRLVELLVIAEGEPR